MQKRKEYKKSTYSFLKSLKNRLSFASKKKKGFLSKDNQNIELLEIEEIEILEEVPTEKVVRTNNNIVEFLDVEEPKLKRRKVRLKPQVRRKIQFTSYALSAACVLLLAFTFFFSNGTMKIGMQNILYRLGIYTEEVREIKIQSNDYNNPGSWKIDKSAKWTGKGKAQVTLEISSMIKGLNPKKKDIIILLDTSYSMKNNKIDTAISRISNLSNIVLEDNENRMAIITVGNDAIIASNLTNNKEELLGTLNGITLSTNANYSDAYSKLDQLMSGYNPENNREVIAIVLTGGYPTYDLSNTTGKYQVLKEKYPYMNIYGIQYEMGIGNASIISKITDKHWFSISSVLSNALLEASMNPQYYQKMQITDTISDEFIIDANSSIKVSSGSAQLVRESDTQKVVWDFGETFATGTKQTITLNLILKEEHVMEEGFFPTSQNEKIVYQLPNESEKTISSALTPVLKSAFEVIYNTNAPAGCDIETIENDKVIAFYPVSKNKKSPSCEGYLFRGWEITEEDSRDVTYVNDDTFLMPQHDIHVRGVWANQNIETTMDGTVYERTTLYKVLEKEAEKGGLAKEYTGPHQDSMNASLSTEKIYHWYATKTAEGIEIQNKNNVVFAGFCWQMIRTTDTGGVRLIYNGGVENGRCLDTRGNQPGYDNSYNDSLTGNYYYATSYTYDKENDVFYLDGDIIQTVVNETTKDNIVGKYTCKKATNDGPCQYMYYVESYVSGTNVTTASINRSIKPNSIGKTYYNETPRNSLSSVGYMYNTSFQPNYKMSNVNTIVEGGNLSSGNYWVADSVTYNPTSKRWTLVDPYQVASGTTNSMAGKFTFTSNSDPTYNYGTVKYVLMNRNGGYFYIYLKAGETTINSVNYDITYGSTYTDNGNGTFTINDPTTIKRSEWSDKNGLIKGKYICMETSSNTCEDLLYAGYTTEKYLYHLSPKNNYVFANDFTYQNGVYTLNSDRTNIWNYVDEAEMEKMNTHHYTCWNNSGQCEQLFYVYSAYKYRFFDTKVYYYNVENGIKADTYREMILHDDNVNVKDSNIKRKVDNWYRMNLLGYEPYIEDSIYCNDRNNSTVGGWNPDGGKITEYIKFGNSQLECPRETDQFSVSNPKARLRYPVAIISYPEMNLLGNSSARKVSSGFWTMTPLNFQDGETLGYVTSDGSMNSGTSFLMGITMRPVITLVPEMKFIYGDGSKDDPYIVDLESVN